MTRPYSEDLRERAVLLAARGETIRAIGAALRISPSCVSKWKKLQAQTGGLAPGRIGGYKKRTLSGSNADWLRARVQSGEAFTLRKLTAELLARGVKTDRRAVWIFLRAEGLTFKKKRSCPPNRSVRTSCANGRAGNSVRPGLTQNASFSSTRHG